MAGWSLLFAQDSISSGCGSQSGRSSVTPRTFCRRLSTRTGTPRPISLQRIIRISGATIVCVLERLREGLRYVRGPRIIASNPNVQIESPRAVWSGKIMLYSSDDDPMEVFYQRVNSLPSPFELEWHHFQGNPGIGSSRE